MAYTSGTATNYHNLMDVLKTYLVSQGWTVLSYTLGTTLTDSSELHIQFPGVNTFNGVLNIRTEFNTGSGFYGWESSVSKSYNPSFVWGSQVDESPSVFTNMWDQSIGYWMYVNDRRVILSLKVSSVYASAFWGMFLPFATPDEYNYPYYIGSNFIALGDFAPPTGFVNYFIASPSINTAFYCSRNSVWKPIENRLLSIYGTDATSYSRNPLGRIFPHGGMGMGFGAGTDSFENWMGNSRPNAAGETLVIPCHIISHDEKTVIGVLDGVHGLPGFGKGTEQQVVLGSRTFRLFQDLNRTTDKSYMAIEEL